MADLLDGAGLDGAGLDRRRTWQPPPRADWAQAVAREGAGMDVVGIVPLDEASLIEAARHNTGLSDFGDDGWREPFQVYLRALRDEADLNLWGRITTRSDLLQLLEARLRIEDTYKRHPEIDDEEITQPIIIMGQGRTGTSILFQILGEDPGNGVLKTWESMYPCPPPERATYLTDPRIERADHLVRQWERVVPALGSMHEFTAEMPTECLQVLALNLTSSWLNVYGQVPSYNAYMATFDWTEAFRYHKRVLKLLQWRNPRKRWVLKTPEYIQYMPPVLEVYPDAGFVWTHRDPVKVMGSIVNLVGTLHWIRTDVPFRHGALDQFTQTDLAAGLLNRAIDWLEDGTVPRERVCHINYQDFVRSPIGAVQDIYRYFGIDMTAEGRAAMERYIGMSKRSNRPAHSYDTGSPEVVADTRRHFERYERYFDVAREV
jgi:hypothetical protein